MSAIKSLRRLLSPLALLALWQAAAMAGLMSPRTLAAPSTILATAWSLTISGELPHHLLVSLARVAVGLVIGVTLGTVLAIWSGLTRLGEDIVDAPMQMLRALPFVGLVPMFILWFGIGETPKIAMVVFASVFPVYLNGFAGIRGIDRNLVEAGRIFGFDGLGLIRAVILPCALPQFLVGLRMSAALGWLSLVVAEQINAGSGIGYLITNARDFLRTDVIIVGLLVYALLGLATDALIRALERWATRGRLPLLTDGSAARIPPAASGRSPPDADDASARSPADPR